MDPLFSVAMAPASLSIFFLFNHNPDHLSVKFFDTDTRTNQVKWIQIRQLYTLLWFYHPNSTTVFRPYIQWIQPVDRNRSYFFVWYSQWNDTSPILWAQQSNCRPNWLYLGLLNLYGSRIRCNQRVRLLRSASVDYCRIHCCYFDVEWKREAIVPDRLSGILYWYSLSCWFVMISSWMIYNYTLSFYC